MKALGLIILGLNLCVTAYGQTNFPYHVNVMGRGIEIKTRGNDFQEITLMGCVGLPASVQNPNDQDYSDRDCTKVRLIKVDSSKTPAWIGNEFPVENIVQLKEDLKKWYSENFVRGLFDSIGSNDIYSFTAQDGWNWSFSPLKLKSMKYRRIVSSALYYAEYKKSSSLQIPIDKAKLSSEVDAFEIKKKNSIDEANAKEEAIIDVLTAKKVASTPVSSGPFDMNFVPIYTNLEKLTFDFQMQTTDVTQNTYLSVVGNNPSTFKDQASCPNSFKFFNGETYCPNNPVENVSWNDARVFIQKLNAQNKDCTYRLPTNVEWAYAAHAGTTSAYYFGNNVNILTHYAWFNQTPEVNNHTHEVAQKPSNQFGLYDMIGNVSQWMADIITEYPQGGDNPPPGPANLRIIHGGSFEDIANNVRTDSGQYIRPYQEGPDLRKETIGFRLVRVCK